MAKTIHVSEADRVFLGTDVSIPLTVTDAVGEPQDITGWTLEWTWKILVPGTPLAETTTVLSKTTASGIVLTTPLSGLCTTTLAAADTAELIPLQVYHHACRRTDAGNNIVLAEGTWVFCQAA